MPAPARPPLSGAYAYPPGAYYSLGRPASWWTTTLRRPCHQPLTDSCPPAQPPADNEANQQCAL